MRRMLDDAAPAETHSDSSPAWRTHGAVGGRGELTGSVRRGGHVRDEVCVHGGALDACERPLIVGFGLTRVSDAAAVDALQRLHAAVDRDRGDSAVALDDLDITVEMSAPFVTMSRALLDVWGADMGPVQPLQVGPSPCPFHIASHPLSSPQRLGLTARSVATQVPEEFLQAEVEGEGAMRLENQLWQCRTHRKMHLELATGARGLEVRYTDAPPQCPNQL